MKKKAEVREIIKKFHSFVSTQFGTLIKVLRSDNGPKFDMRDFFGDKGIVHHTSCVNTPQLNAVVKQKHQHILNVARTLYFPTQLPLEFWGHCVMHVVFLINRLPSPVIEELTPYHKLQNKDPDPIALRVFGCLCFASTLPNMRNKMDLTNLLLFI